MIHLSIGGDGGSGHYHTGPTDEARISGRALNATEVQTEMKTPVLYVQPPGHDYEET